MGVKTIYLPDELCLKLKEEQNASGLIANLLFDYYKTKIPKTIEELEREIREKENNLITIKTIKQKEIETIEGKKKELEQQEKTEKEIKEEQEQKLNQKRENIIKEFKSELQREPTEKEINNYLLRIEQGEKINIYTYIEEIKEKETSEL